MSELIVIVLNLHTKCSQVIVAKDVIADAVCVAAPRGGRLISISSCLIQDSQCTKPEILRAVL